jgi:hypothetical protein
MHLRSFPLFKIFIFLTAFIFNARLVFSQFSAPPIVWEKRYGNFGEQSKDVAIAPDSTILVVGQSQRNGGEVTGHHGSNDSLDAWVVKLDTGGNMLWQKSIGGSGHDFLNTIISATSCGYLCIGSSKSNDGDLADNTTRYGAWLVKLSPAGDIQWSKTFGGGYADNCYSGVLLQDGSIALVVVEDEYWNICSVLKLDTSGNVVWRSQGNAFTGRYIVETKDHTLLTSSGLVFDPVTGDTSRFTGFPGGYIQALKTINNKIYVSLKDGGNDGINKAGYFDDASGSFIYQEWTRDVQSEDGTTSTSNVSYNGLGAFTDGSFITAGNTVNGTRGGVFSYPLLYTLGQSYRQYGGDEYAQYNSIKAFPSGNAVISCLWAWYENKFWIIKYDIPRVTARWTGAVDTAWENPGNWSTNAVPGRSTKVLVPANVPNYPVVNSHATCFSLQVDSTASIVINTGFNVEVTGK